MALFDNLLVAGILISLVIIIYCKVTKKTLFDVIREIREGVSTEDE